MFAVKFNGVSKTIKKDEILHDINFELEKGKVYGFIGRNGSGKTMIFRIICGMVRPTKGTVEVMGVDITKKNKFPENLGAILEVPGFIPHYSGTRNLKILANLSGRADNDRIRESIKIVGLDPDNQKPVNAYSLGMRQRLGIAQAIMEDPRLLVLDEPMNGLDEDGVKEMRALFKKLNKEGVTILLASHNKDDIESLCDELIYVKNGRIE